MWVQNCDLLKSFGAVGNDGKKRYKQEFALVT